MLYFSLAISCFFKNLLKNKTKLFFFCFFFLKVVLHRFKGMALILYNNTDFAQAAVRETKGWKIGGNKIKVNNECHLDGSAFLCHMYLY